MGDRDRGYRKFGVVFVLIGFSVFVYFFGFDIYNWYRFGEWDWRGFDLVFCSFMLGSLGVVLLVRGAGVWFVRVGFVLLCYLGISFILWNALAMWYSPG